MPPKGKKPPRAKPYNKGQRKSSKGTSGDTSQDTPLLDIVLPGDSNQTPSVIMEPVELTQPGTSQSEVPIVNQPTPLQIPQPPNNNLQPQVRDDAQPVSRIEFLSLQRAMADMSSKFMAFISATQPSIPSATAMPRSDIIPSTTVVTSQPSAYSQLQGVPLSSTMVTSQPSTSSHSNFAI